MTAPATTVPAATAPAMAKPPPMMRTLPWFSTRVHISTRSDSGIFPDTWLHPPALIRAQPVDEGAVGTATRSVEVAAQKYPPELMQLLLGTVYILGGINTYATELGGTNSNSNVYVVASPSIRGFVSADVELEFHHEFSSVLFRHYWDLFDKAAWTSCNPPEFTYANDQYGAARSGVDAFGIDRGTVAMGFVNEYAREDVENDFNCVAGQLFMNRDEFWRVADQNPRLRKKIDIAISFYHAIDSRFTEELFRSMMSFR